MAASGAIVTVQLGKLANFTGAHFWNFQDETLGHVGATDSEVAQEAQDVLAGKLFTHTQQPAPRLVVVDAPGCCGGHRLAADYADANVQDVQRLWAGGVEEVRAPAVTPSSFATLLLGEDEAEGREAGVDEAVDETPGEGHQEAQTGFGSASSAQVALEAAAAALNSGPGPRFFTDFQKVLMSPHSVVQVPTGLLGAEGGVQGGFGAILADNSARQEALLGVEERLRVLAEEAHSIEGFHVVCDPGSHWAGVADDVLQLLADEHPGACCIAFGPEAEPEARASQPVVRRLSTALAACRWGAFCTLRVPLHLPPTAPELLYDVANAYHSSALFAAAIDTCTLAYRAIAPPSSSAAAAGRPGRGCSMAELAADLAVPAANVAAVGMRLPGDWGGELSIGPEADARLPARERRLRGLPALDAARVGADLVGGDITWLLDTDSPLEGMLSESLMWRGPAWAKSNTPPGFAVQHLHASLEAEGVRAVHRARAVAMPLALPLPFPPIVRAYQDVKKPVDAPAPPTSSVASKKHLPRFMPVLTRLVASKALGKELASHAAVLAESKRDGSAKSYLHQWGLEALEVEELREGVLSLADRYGIDHSDDDSSVSD